MSRNLNAAEPTEAWDAVVRFDDVSMRYGREPETLKDLTFSLPQGSFHFVTGPSGAGKTSLLKLIYLAAQPSKGLLHLFGQDVARAPADVRPFLRRRIGVVFQEFRLLDHLSAFDNAAVPLRIAGQKPDSYRQDVAELLTWVGLKDRMHVLPPTLAGGEKQRLAIARAVVSKPELILADEPTGSVDKPMGERLLKLFQSLNRLGTTVLIASHDEVLAERSGATVLRLEGGRLTGGAA
jgi:cell division transport system ATP-binding protein